MLANYLTQAGIGGFADLVLTLRFSSSVLFAAEFCRKRQEEIQRALQDFFGSRLTVRFELSGEPAARPVPKPAPAAVPATRQQRINQSRNLKTKPSKKAEPNRRSLKNESGLYQKSERVD